MMTGKCSLISLYSPKVPFLPSTLLPGKSTNTWRILLRCLSLDNTRFRAGCGSQIVLCVNCGEILAME
jgi:hypothetical protein